MPFYLLSSLYVAFKNICCILHTLLYVITYYIAIIVILYLSCLWISQHNIWLNYWIWNASLLCAIYASVLRAICPLPNVNYGNNYWFVLFSFSALPAQEPIWRREHVHVTVHVYMLPVTMKFIISNFSNSQNIINLWCFRK